MVQVLGRKMLKGFPTLKKPKTQVTEGHLFWGTKQFLGGDFKGFGFGFSPPLREHVQGRSHQLDLNHSQVNQDTKNMFVFAQRNAHIYI